MVTAALERGINWFDTAEMYGRGASERALAAALLAAGQASGDVVVATKWMPLFRTAGSINATIDERLRCLAPFAIDLHQVHQPVGLSSVESRRWRRWRTWWRNEDPRRGGEQLQPCSDAPRPRGVGGAQDPSRVEPGAVQLAQPPRRVGWHGRNGEGAGGDDHRLFAARPGSADRQVPRRPGVGEDAARPAQVDGRVQGEGARASRPLVEELRSIAAAHGATASQVALAWLCQFHGETVVVIPGASRPQQAEENAGALELALSQAEIGTLDKLSRRFM